MSQSQQDREDPTVGVDDLAAVEQLRGAHDRIRADLGKVIVGQDRVIEELLIALFAGGHCILEGVPGLAKTLMISTLARTLDLTFSRIQFTPDLMPSDITGTEVIQEDKATGSRSFRFLRGPVFANVVLADEINRTPPKTQAALLEAMQERQVTVGGQRHKLDEPFFVLATQNPIEQEGTYPLPEAQQDRFMFKVFVGYPSYEEELAIAEVTAADIAKAQDAIAPVLHAEQVLRLQELVRKVPIARQVVAHALDLVRRTRPGEPEAPEITRQMIRWGAGPRAVQFMVLAAKARAVLHGQYHASVEDIRAAASPVLRHRIVTTYSAEAQGYSPDRIVDELLNLTPPHESALSQDDRLRKVLGS
jgi:MoxR-like ATPase